MQCQNCGSQVFDAMPNGAARCRYCGNMIQGVFRPAPNAFQQQMNNVGSNIQAGKKDKWIAIILAVFLGGVGAQYFYLGKMAPGIISLIFFWTGIPALWGLIFAIILLTKSDTEFNEQYNKPQPRH